MQETRVLEFGPFRLDLVAERLWREAQAVPLTAKAFAVLCYLVRHAGRLVTRDELIAAVWGLPAVSDAALTVCMGEIRRVLGDTARPPQFLETVRGRGYRFGTAVRVGPSPLGEVAGVPGRSPDLLVGRAAELGQLQQCWAQACEGCRQVVFITGEAGIGKTTLVDAFVAQVTATAAVWSARGQCIEHYGAGEAYLPLLEALGQLGRGPDGAQLVALLHQVAPTWLVHLPALVPAADDEAVQRRAGGATRERMLRELAEAVEALTAAHPLILALEDLHWSDGATLDWLAVVARRRAAARLLVLGTYRPADAVVQAHPVRRVTYELQVHGQGVELALGALAEAEVAAYLRQRFGAGAQPAGLARVLHQRTEGNPLFLVTVAEELVRRGVVQPGPAGWALAGSVAAVSGAVPESLRQLVEQQLEQLPPEAQQLLEAASIVGLEFTAAAVAAAVEQGVEAAEDRAATLARRGQFVQIHGEAEWPDGTVTTRYGFRHALYREILYERVPVSRRLRWHRQIGRRLEAGYGPQACEVAAELAEHFMRGRDTERAVQYLYYAGEQAVQRSAHQEAMIHLTKGLELLATLPATLARAQQELDLRMALGSVLIATKGQAAPEVEQTYARARALCAQVGEMPQLFPTLRGLYRFYLGGGALQTAREFGEQLDRLAHRAADPTYRLAAHEVLGQTLFYLGEYAAAWTHFEQGIALTDSAAQLAMTPRYGEAPGVRCLAVAADTLWCLGYPAQAVQRSKEALALARAVAHPYSLAQAHQFAALLHHRRREVPMVQVQADTLLTLGTAQGFPLFVGYGTCWRGWALAMQSQGEAGLALLRQGMIAILATGQTLTLPVCLILLAEAAGHTGQVEAGLHLLAEALAACEASGRGDMLTEAYRLQGELLLRQGTPDVTRAEACFHQALAVARRRQAKSWELRAAMSLSRMWQQQGKRDEARELLAPIYGWFTEGFDTADLQEAKALLEELA
jgi:DNA-binding winged helix-turn-helix (wHTH) protein/predicted ATPase